MALLREYHAAVGEIIVRYNGTLERYAGDGIMIIFNDPIPVSNPALQAVQMALEMRRAIDALTDKWRQLGHEIGFGIGIAHGYATLGTNGFEGRFDYAAIGGVCAGAVIAVIRIDRNICGPRGSDVDQAVRVVVQYIDSRPTRLHEDFSDLAAEALRAAWSCPSAPTR
jgi:Rap1a immunity proteins/Adenylate and Guanylate cyclase catalytic domain